MPADQKTGMNNIATGALLHAQAMEGIRKAIFEEKTDPEALILKAAEQLEWANRHTLMGARQCLGLE